MNSTNERKSSLKTQNHNNSLQLKDFLSPRTLDLDSTLTIDEKKQTKDENASTKLLLRGWGTYFGVGDQGRAISRSLVEQVGYDVR
jgi:hypothetical protein